MPTKQSVQNFGNALQQAVASLIYNQQRGVAQSALSAPQGDVAGPVNPSNEDILRYIIQSNPQMFGNPFVQGDIKAAQAMAPKFEQRNPAYDTIERDSITGRELNRTPGVGKPAPALTPYQKESLRLREEEAKRKAGAGGSDVEGRQNRATQSKLKRQRAGLEGRIRVKHGNIDLDAIYEGRAEIPMAPEKKWDTLSQENVSTGEMIPDKDVLEYIDIRSQLEVSGAGPESTGKQLDEATATQILREAGGDKNKARQIAKQRGYKL